MYYPSSENKGADQLRGYREADLRLCFRLCRLLVFPWGGSYFFCICRSGETPEAYEMMSLNQNNVTENNNIPMDADPMFSADNKSNLPVRDKDGESLEFLAHLSRQAHKVSL